jgi:trimeric autotransporter adhesin
MLKTVSAFQNAIGALNYKGSWDASTNTPTLVSSVGNKGDYYVVSVAGNTNLNGITLWSVGDWAVFNGSVWQKIDGGSNEAFNSITVTTLTGYMFANNTSPVTASTTIPVANVTGAVPNTVYILAGTNLTGGGALTGNVTLNNPYNGTVTSVATGTGLTGGTITSSGTISLANTTVTAGTYGSSSSVAQVTINAQGQITSASNVGITIPSGNVTGLGTMATQNANAVVITGGTINSTTQTNGVYANANITSVAVTFPNSYLSNSAITLGNTSVSLGSTASSLGNLTLANVTISSGNATFTNANATNSTITNFSSGNVTITGGTENNATYTNVTISSGNITVNNANLTYANITTALRTQGLTGYLYGNANTGNVTASTTIPNSGLANSTIGLGNATLTLGSTTTTVGNLTLANANITSVATAFPNSYLANSSVTLGNTSVSLGGTATSIGNLTLNNVTINGGSISNIAIGGAITTKNANYTATSSDETILGNASTGNITITMPTAVGITGKTYIIKKVDSSANVVIVATTSSQTIDGIVTRNIVNQYDSMQIQTDGANWFIIGFNAGRNGTSGSF